MIEAPTENEAASDVDRIDRILSLTAKELVELLEDDGLTKGDISRQSGVNRPTVSRLSLGTREAGEEIWRQLAKLAIKRKVV